MPPQTRASRQAWHRRRHVRVVSSGGDGANGENLGYGRRGLCNIARGQEFGSEGVRSHEWMRNVQGGGRFMGQLWDCIVTPPDATLRFSSG
ncbi:hypothetical protein VTO73DRAFT_6935 [Trametes versicolor]